nr:MAG TPA: hypothetical protein [Caudoviricetes sp.]
MQIEIVKDALTIMGEVKEGMTLNVDPHFAQTLISIGVAKIRDSVVSTGTEPTKRAKKGKR